MNKVIYIFILIIIMSMLGYYYKVKESQEDFIENFNDYTKVEEYDTPAKIYNKFYSNIYDELFGNAIRNEFELFNIKMATLDERKDFKKEEVKVLDLGCGTGGHLKLLHRDKLQCVGLDKSMSMLEKSRNQCPDVQLVKGDYHNASIFKPREFSHVLCLFYTIYYSNNVDKVFKNVNTWLKPKGYFCLHLVNPKKFDPVLEKSSKLIPLYNPQRHSDSRVTKTKLKFNKFNYVSDWEFNDTNVKFTENFLFNDNMVHKKNVHQFTMYPIKYYMNLAKKNGFKLIKIIDLIPVNHDNSYVYIFQKVYGQ